MLDELVGELAATAPRRCPPTCVAPTAARALVERAGRVDILVANTALPGSGRLDEYSAEEIDRALDVNLRAPIAADARAAARR